MYSRMRSSANENSLQGLVGWLGINGPRRRREGGVYGRKQVLQQISRYVMAGQRQGRRGW